MFSFALPASSSSSLDDDDDDDDEPELDFDVALDERELTRDERDTACSAPDCGLADPDFADPDFMDVVDLTDAADLIDPDLERLAAASGLDARELFSELLSSDESEEFDADEPGRDSSSESMLVIF